MVAIEHEFRSCLCAGPHPGRARARRTILLSAMMEAGRWTGLRRHHREPEPYSGQIAAIVCDDLPSHRPQKAELAHARRDLVDLLA